MLAKKLGNIITYQNIPSLLIFDLKLPAFSHNFNHPYAEKTECLSKTILEL